MMEKKDRINEDWCHDRCRDIAERCGEYEFSGICEESRGEGEPASHQGQCGMFSSASSANKKCKECEIFELKEELEKRNSEREAIKSFILRLLR